MSQAMEKRKPKPQPGLLREILIGVGWAIGLFFIIGLVAVVSLMICGALFLRAVFGEDVFYFSKDIPYEQRYHLTGESYMANWQHWDTDRVEGPRSRAIRRDDYQKAFTDDITLKTQIDFVYYDSVDYVHEHLVPDASRYYGSVVDYKQIQLENLKTDLFSVGCIYISKTETMPYVLERHSCQFEGTYGSCFIVVTSDVLEPYVSSNDYKQLIKGYIDPQMAAWDVCYGREPAKTPES